MTTEERLYKLEGIVEGVMATLPGQVASLEGRMELFRQEVKAEIGGLRQEMVGLRQEVKAEINPAFNKLMLYFTALAAALAILTFLR
ncbi:hypothetical protein CSW37_12520 [Thermus scotoductus]|uniref:DUF1640 domain-containing protein n=1 Tax=Thermus scotoductus TaxID=37636 RepID=A0A430S8U0_THESC|nr:hypothetical protein [Thermus scotoductus]RTH32147.1 hypothetical protein CSW37_12520 [Thermus scotoductus]